MLQSTPSSHNPFNQKQQKISNQQIHTHTPTQQNLSLKRQKIPEGDWYCSTCRPRELSPLAVRKVTRNIKYQDGESDADDGGPVANDDDASSVDKLVLMYYRGGWGCFAVFLFALVLLSLRERKRRGWFLLFWGLVTFIIVTYQLLIN